MPFLMVCLVGLLVSVDASPVSSPMIEGQVRLSNGSPVVGAQVVLFDVADLRRGPVGQATTDETGQFVLPLAAGGGWVLPSEVGLGPNYPNPFNPSTLIPYQLAATSPVRLEVFNVLGQRVATLVDEAQSAGAYVARWDGTDAAGRAAASGVYFYRLTVAGAHWTGKMVLVDGQAGVPLGGARVAAVPLAEGSSATYGLVVSGEGLVTYVDSDFVVGGGQGPVEVVVSAEPNGRGKVVASLEGVLGDVDNNGRVDLDDGLLVAMLSVDPALSLPRHGLMTLGDVNCDGRVELADATLLAAYVANPSDSAVSSLRMGQPGGYSLDPVTEIVWGSILGTEQSDPTVARILDGVPVLLSGVLSVGIDGEDRVYLGIDRAYWTQQGGKQLYEALKQRFPATPIHVEPSVGVIPLSGKAATRPTTTALRQVAPVTRFGPPMSFADSPNAALSDNSKAPKVVGSITVPDDVIVGSVSVAVDITHPSRGDLKIDLVAPSGVVVPLYNGIRRGVDLADNITGTIATTDALQGQAAKGTWQLRVGDYEQGDAGTLNAWELTVTPAQETPATEEPVNLFLETFQDGLDAWRTTAWEAASLDTDSGVPGEGPGNIVAKAEGCSVCFLTLDTPVDLSAHDSVTLSFYRWLDPGMSNSEFLGVDIGNDGSYQRLKNWSGQDADGEWHLETFTLSGDQISDSFTLRFFGIAQNNFTTVAIDNVMIAATPGTVTITPDEPTTPEPATTQDTPAPDLSVGVATASPTTVQSTDTVTIQATVRNTGATAPATTVRIYRHRTRTNTPRTRGTRETNTATTTTLASNRSVRVTSTHEAPTVTSTTTYYYYVCVDTVANETQTDNNCSTPARVAVQPKPEEVVVDLSALSMGGDVLLTHEPGGPPLAGGTITLGGLETMTGVPGFVTSAHVVAPENPDRTLDFTAGLNTFTSDWFGNLFGKVFRLPTLQRVETDTGGYNLLPADAAFVAYPHPKTPGCSLTFTDRADIEFCLDVGAGEYLERIQPLKVKGKSGAVHTVVGSKEPAEDLNIRFFGAASDVAKDLIVEEVKFLSSKFGYSNYISIGYGSESIPGNSGAPIYTLPDASGNVRMVGILEGSIFIGDSEREGISFSSWDDVEEALDLKPISAPDSPIEEDEEDEEDEEELADLFSAFD